MLPSIHIYESNTFHLFSRLCRKHFPRPKRYFHTHKLVPSDNFTWSPMAIVGIICVHLSSWMLRKHTLLHAINAENGFGAKPSQMGFPHWLIMISRYWPDFTLVRYKYPLFICIYFASSVTLINPCKFLVIQSVRLRRVYEVFRKLGHLSWPGDLTFGDLGLTFNSLYGKDAWWSVPNMSLFLYFFLWKAWVWG